MCDFSHVGAASDSNCFLNYTFILANTPSVHVCKHPFHFSHFLRKVVSAINGSIVFVNITKLSFVCREMLTCALRAQDNDLKTKLNNKYCIEKISF
jgi:hypothetical protein